jgi:hypothetical protein
VGSAICSVTLAEETYRLDICGWLVGWLLLLSWLCAYSA